MQPQLDLLVQRAHYRLGSMPQHVSPIRHAYINVLVPIEVPDVPPLGPRSVKRERRVVAHSAVVAAGKHALGTLPDRFGAWVPAAELVLQILGGSRLWQGLAPTHSQTGCLGREG